MKRRLVVVLEHRFGGLIDDRGRAFGDLGGDVVGAVGEASFRDTIELAETLTAGPTQVPPDLVLGYSGDRAWYQQRLSNFWLLLPLMGSDLSQYLDNLLLTLGVGPDDQTIFIGPRTPHLPVRELAEAFTALGHQQLAIGACEGQGIYLLGVAGRWPCGLFGGVRWNTPHAERDLRKQARRARLTTASLPRLYRLEEERDCRRLEQDLGLFPDRALANFRRLLNSADSI